MLARDQAAEETGLSLDVLPLNCPYAVAKVLDEAYLPD
ncbi:MAG: DUF29 family protein [Nodosilinea sp.]